MSIKIRPLIKALEREKAAVYSELQILYTKYIDSLKPDQHGIYISDHAIVRYLERVKGVKFNLEMSDSNKLTGYKVSPEEIRKEMLTIEEDRAILRGQKTRFKRGTYSYVVKELTITTVLNSI